MAKTAFLFLHPVNASLNFKSFFRKICSDKTFREAFDGAMLVWEIPDTPGARGEFIENPFEDGTLRQLGGVWFFTGTVTKP